MKNIKNSILTLEAFEVLVTYTARRAFGLFLLVAISTGALIGLNLALHSLGSLALAVPLLLRLAVYIICTVAPALMLYAVALVIIELRPLAPRRRLLYGRRARMLILYGRELVVVLASALGSISAVLATEWLVATMNTPFVGASIAASQLGNNLFICGASLICGVALMMFRLSLSRETPKATSPQVYAPVRRIHVIRPTLRRGHSPR